MVDEYFDGHTVGFTGGVYEAGYVAVVTGVNRSYCLVVTIY